MGKRRTTSKRLGRKNQRRTRKERIPQLPLQPQHTRRNNDNTVLQRLSNEAKARIRYLRKEDRYVIILCIGLNDTRKIGTDKEQQTMRDEFSKNIQELINKAKKYTPEVIITGLPPVDETKTQPFEETYFDNETIQQYEEVIKEQATKARIPFVSLYQACIKKGYVATLEDGIHPNTKGHELIYKIIREELLAQKQKLLAKKLLDYSD